MDGGLAKALASFAALTALSCAIVVGVAQASETVSPDVSVADNVSVSASSVPRSSVSANPTASPTTASASSRVASLAARTQASSTWIADIASRTDIPARAVQAYGKAVLVAEELWPQCHLGWNTLAAIGYLESGNGTHNGGTIGDNGDVTPTIIGPALDGSSYDAQTDSDDGEYDGDSTWDHAVGPLQFIPTTWERSGVDGNGDGRADPNNIDDAAVSAAKYVCAGGRDLTVAGEWTAAIRSYNHSDSYIASVREFATRYATLSSEG